MISSSLPPIISGETSVTSTNIEAFLDTSKVYSAAIEFLSKKIAVRLLDALCHYEYEKKTVKSNRRLPEADRKDIILEEIRNDGKFGSDLSATMQTSSVAVDLDEEEEFEELE
ncbi:hypothetical protein ADUPG1_004891 [Aduncisulcus paluster]|uniref:Uncharacterized protein n=1 Tax=Aduncisulcus paluster TaxID=2918883 RepID=A0ABQ5K6V8_9EUKA|nr:hypothetical protein ADUPG1_004891 [Aduncisulcus paluster]